MPDTVNRQSGVGPVPVNVPHGVDTYRGAADVGDGSTVSMVIPLPAATTAVAPTTMVSLRIRTLLADACTARQTFSSKDRPWCSA
ncbi:hypothetical protein AAFP35_19225 [Gordonia sp. CPCC 206044]|uniref:hypothetical protein n=1 Tax=Gordonia sp. CPCC 206044 TaxID=3140793 RepID=UPI003AF3630A